MKDLISVVIPVYNVERFLEKCITSILEQSYSNLEIIIVNDGSTDNCLSICKEFEKIDNRIILINQDNKGLAESRNVGTRIAKGQYIVFIDSDDFVGKNHISNLYSIVSEKNVKLGITNFKKVEIGEIIHLENVKAKQKIKLYDKQTALKELFLQKEFDNSAWAKIYHISLFDDIEYPKGKLYEDLPVTYKLIEKNEFIGYMDTKDYYYVNRPESILNMNFNEKKLDLVDFVNEMFKKYENDEFLCKYAGTRAFASLFNLWRNIPKKNKYKNIVWNNLVIYRKYPLLTFSSKLKLKLGSLISIFGNNIVSFLFRQ